MPAVTVAHWRALLIQAATRIVEDVFAPLVTGHTLDFSDSDNSGWLTWVA